MKLRDIIICFSLATSAGAAVHHVDKGVGSSGVGDSWADAFATLQEALAVAVADDVILVAEGVYYPHEGGAPTEENRTATFQLLDGVEIRGGYPSGGGARDLAAHVTVLSGDIDQNDEGTPTGMNSFTVVTASGTDATAILDGFRIQGGLADGPGADAFDGPTRAGGGMYMTGGSPTIRNCQFRGNDAGFGGGVFSLDFSTPAFINCVFSGNRAAFFGGGLNNRYSSVSLINCTITGNSAGSPSGAGGGMASFVSFPTLTNCIVWNNLDNGDTESANASIQNGGDSVTTLNHCLVQNEAPGGTNLDGTDPANAPRFLVPPFPSAAPSPAGDVRLAVGSPALDAGDQAANPLGTDVAGNARVQGAAIDLGAYEGAFEPPVIPVLHVDQGNATPGDGTSWATAFLTLRDALAVVVPGQRILVAAGVYFPDEGGGAADDDREASFGLISEVEIHGGYPPGGGDRDLAANVTVLSGDIDGNDTGTPAGGNSFSVVTADGVNATGILDGFLIRGGLGNDSAGETGPTVGGGGLFITGGRPTIRNCRFAGNSALLGGAVLAVDSGRPVFTNCSFEGNHADAFGGAAHIRDGAQARFVNCSLSGNAAGSGGGGIAVFSASLNLVNSIVWNNEADGSLSTASASVNIGGTSNFMASFSLVQNVSPGGDNLDGTDSLNDPLFVNPPNPSNAPGAGGDLRLSAGSAALDRGDNGATPLATDLLGEARIQNATIDIGAYEGAQVAADGDMDGISDAFELAHTEPPSTTALDPASDLDRDFITALEEFAYGLDPNEFNRSSDAYSVEVVTVDEVEYLAVIYNANPGALVFLEIIPEYSTDLGLTDAWSDEGLVFSVLPDSRRMARSEFPFKSRPTEFLHLRVQKR